MQIYVDADACPKVIKEILFRAAERLHIQLTLVANKLPYCPPSKVIRTMQVPAGFGVADNKIAQLVEPDDLVITADIPLAADVIARGGHALNPRGEFYTKDTMLAAAGCDFGQGYLFSMAVPAEEFEALLLRQQKRIGS